MAHERGVMLAFEPLNRFETNLLNLTSDSIEFAKAVGSPASQLLLDTFHMHIEEKNTPAALTAAAKAGVLGHVHLSENDRGIAGSGQIHWQPVANALRTSGYKRWVVLESFCQTNQAIKRAVSCWRPFFDNPLTFCEQGLKFVKGLMKE
jgi:D-psicose/D-tagatose/L-ribulose 3-epimerase